MARRRTTVVLSCAAALFVVPALAQAEEIVFDSEGDEEVLVDPELDGPEEERLADPELDAPERRAVETEEISGDFSEPAIWRGVVRGRIGVDTAWDVPAEDVLEATEIAVLEVEQRRSESVVLSLGLRVRHAYGLRRENLGGGRSRTQLDLAPVSGYADVTLAEGMHLRAGYQTITLGRFDLFTAVNFLAVADARSGPVTMPEAAAIAQPALRFDIDRIPNLTFQAFYVPFFQPHAVDLFGTDYALLADQRTDAADPNSAARELADSIGRSRFAAAGDGALDFFAPEPNFDEPQGALRATHRFGWGELAATAGTALERVPALVRAPSLVPTGPLSSVRGDLVYNRFSVLALDGAFDVGPLAVGFEAAYAGGRTLPTTARSPVGGSLILGERVDVAQGALRAEYIASLRWVAATEAFVAVALEDPSDPDREFFTAEQGRYWRGAAVFVRYAPKPFTFEMGGIIASGPTGIVSPRVEWEVTPSVAIEAGAVVVEGERPPVAYFPPSTSVGGLYDSVDQVFVGARFRP